MLNTHIFKVDDAEEKVITISRFFYFDRNNGDQKGTKIAKIFRVRIINHPGIYQKTLY